MYQAASTGLVPDTTDKSYDRVQRLVLVMRRRGLIPYDWISDGIRDTIRADSWASLQDFVDVVRECYRKDFWPTLPVYCEVICEKDAIAGAISQVTKQYGIPLRPLRGFSSETFAWEIGEEWRDIDKPIHVFFLGDHDPSGWSLGEDIERKAQEFAKKKCHFHRLAVLPEHFEKFNLRPLAVKKHDSRAVAFIERFGPECAEIDAIPIEALRGMLEESILSLIPQDKWAALQRIEEMEKQSWAAFTKKMPGAPKQRRRRE